MGEETVGLDGRARAAAGPPRWPRGLVGRHWRALALIVVLGLTLGPVPRAGAASHCRTSGPTSGAYTVTLCLTAPVAAAVVAGLTTTTATATLTGTAAPGVQRMIFYLDGQYLLTDFSSPYAFLLPTERWVDGSHTLAAEVLLRDGFTSARTSIAVTFRNGVTQPPVNPRTFTPSAGTAPVPGQPFVVAAVGDGAGGRNEARQVTDLIASWTPNLFLYLGDVYEQGTPTEFLNWYGTADTFFGRFRAITNPAIGNHEYLADDGAGYFDYWDNLPHFFSFDAGGWHFASVDSTGQFAQLKPGTAQYEWLRQDLAANAGKCTIVYFHHPPYSVGPASDSGDTTRVQSLWPLLVESGVDAVLTAHDHDYQRWHPLDAQGQRDDARGVPLFVVGTGGHGIQGFVTGDARLAAGADTTTTAFGALRLALTSQGATFTFQNVAGATLDSGSIACAGGVGDTTPPTQPAGLTAAAPFANRVELAWNPATDERGVAGYGVFRDGALLTTLGDVTAYVDTSTRPGTTYSYTVDAVDFSGNRSAPSSPAVVTTPASQFLFLPLLDAQVDASRPTTNLGGALTLRVDADPVNRSYLRFDVQGVSAVSQATLRVFANSSSSVGYEARGLANPASAWSEGEITYANAPAVAATVAGTSGATVAGSWSSADVTSLVGGLAGSGALSIALAGSSSTAISLAARETGATGPQLIVEAAAATPSPTPAPTPTPTPTPPPTPAVLTFAPVADAHVNSGSRSTNYGSSPLLRLDARPTMRAYLRFEVQGVTGSVARATLRLFSPSGSSVGYSAHRVSSITWDESTIRFTNAPTVGAQIGSSGAFAEGTWSEVDVTPAIAGNGVLSLALTTTSTTQMSLNSRESASNRPELVLTIRSAPRRRADPSRR